MINLVPTMPPETEGAAINVGWYLWAAGEILSERIDWQEVQKAQGDLITYGSCIIPPNVMPHEPMTAAEVLRRLGKP